MPRETLVMAGDVHVDERRLRSFLMLAIEVLTDWPKVDRNKVRRAKAASADAMEAFERICCDVDDLK